MKKKQKLTQAQELLGIHLKELGLPFLYEYTFLEDRRFRFDVYLYTKRIGIECDGGMWTGGHRHAKAIEQDNEKSNLAQVNGYKCLRFTNRQIETGEAKAFIARYLLQSGDPGTK